MLQDVLNGRLIIRFRQPDAEIFQLVCDVFGIGFQPGLLFFEIRVHCADCRSVDRILMLAAYARGCFCFCEDIPSPIPFLPWQKISRPNVCGEYIITAITYFRSGCFFGSTIQKIDKRQPKISFSLPALPF